MAVHPDSNAAQELSVFRGLKTPHWSCADARLEHCKKVKHLKTKMYLCGCSHGHFAGFQQEDSADRAGQAASSNHSKLLIMIMFKSHNASPQNIFMQLKGGLLSETSKYQSSFVF